MTRETKNRLQIALPILQGLLASGKYTDFDPYQPDVVGNLRYDLGKDYDKNYSTRRRPSRAIEDALELADELIAETKLDERAQKETNT